MGGAHKRRQAFLERAVLLDHLFCCDNMSVQVAKKLMNVISQFTFLRAKTITCVFILLDRSILSLCDNVCKYIRWYMRKNGGS